MPGSWLNIGFGFHYGDGRASEQIFIKPFREGMRQVFRGQGV
jgi:hypothetical protein